jgi:hypothetical protein
MRWMAALIWRLPPRSRRCRSVRPELTGIGASPAARASLASLAKRPAPAISPTSLAAVSGPNPGSRRSCGAICVTSAVISVSSWFDRLGELAWPAQLVARDPDAHRLLGARQAPRDPRTPRAVEQRAARQHELGPEIVPVPLQPVVEPDARPDQPRWHRVASASIRRPPSRCTTPGKTRRPLQTRVATPTNGLPAGSIIACGDLTASKAGGKSKPKKPHPPQAKGPKSLNRQQNLRSGWRVPGSRLRRSRPPEADAPG